MLLYGGKLTLYLKLRCRCVILNELSAWLYSSWNFHWPSNQIISNYLALNNQCWFKGQYHSPNFCAVTVEHLISWLCAAYLWSVYPRSTFPLLFSLPWHHWHDKLCLHKQYSFVPDWRWFHDITNMRVASIHACWWVVYRDLQNPCNTVVELKDSANPAV